MPKRIFNFSAGPSTLPPEVLAQAARGLVNHQDLGMSVIEISHRAKPFMAVIEEAEQLLRELLDIPDNYKVLFLQGGASMQFAMIPMNLLRPDQMACYLNTGVWAKKAIKEAKLFGKIEVAYSSEGLTYNHVPAPADYQVSPGAEYLYFVSNNTIYGTQFHSFPTPHVPMVCDMSSDILSRPFDIRPFGLVFAGAQKNMGPAGVTVVIIREDLLTKTPGHLPTIFKYRTHVESASMFNTPPCFAIYVVGLVLKWLKGLGGVAAIEQINREKAALLYDTIDRLDFYRGHARRDSRSLMNVTFNLPSPELETKFVKEATALGLDGLKGHRSVGGCRASIYNAFPREGVERLVSLMEDFAARN
ncbi:MAG: 3-phosphoserine/phosphohydroxythreonine transaminase [Desulfobulbaceae bacterium]|nr:MAG: 3-phosphoserine/phosphohydroxythreonine transaminase [Desulfobulbaceae bacterium]